MTKELPKVVVYSVGIVAMSVCADNSATKEEIEAQANSEYPTGIGSKWSLSKDTHFAEGNTNPCPCNEHPETRKHYLLNC